MAGTTYGKGVPERARKKRAKNRHHHGLPQLMVELCGCSLTMAYKVIYGQAVSAKVQAAMKMAQQQLKGRAA